MLTRIFLFVLLFALGQNAILSQTPGRPATSGQVFNPDWAPFLHGVASGDPLSDRVIIWTKLTIEDGSNASLDVSWKVCSDVDLMNVVAEGVAIADPSSNYTIKVDVDGLQPGETYYYNFTNSDRSSLIGKTKTTPIEDQVDHLRFGVVSCSNFQAGYFNGYEQLSKQHDLDAIIHLGDYIYEYGDQIFGNDSIAQDRKVEPTNETLTLDDYRLRYSTYRLDTQLVRMHQQHPIIAVWDDHETANDSYADGAQNHDPATEGLWAERKAMAKQAYFEWMPIRENLDYSVYRKISYGNLLDLIMLDTRLEGREMQLADVTAPELLDTNRTILGVAQKDWFFEQLTNSTATWKVIGQQIIFSEVNVGWSALTDTSISYNQAESLLLDIWDGYPAERSEIIRFLGNNNINNAVILTGDFHSSFAFDVTEAPVEVELLPAVGFGEIPSYTTAETYDPASGAGSVAVEFATPSITSSNFDEGAGIALATVLQNQINRPLEPLPGISLGNPNPHLKYVDLINHGYFILDIKVDSVQADWYHTPILMVSDSVRWDASLYTLADSNHLLRAGAPTKPKANNDAPAPFDPPNNTTSSSQYLPSFTTLQQYPNPARDLFNIDLALNAKRSISAEIYNSSGVLMQRPLSQVDYSPGIHRISFDVMSLPQGAYIISLTVGTEHFHSRFLKGE